MNDLTNKNILITGAAQGIGLGITKHALKNNSNETFGFYWLFPTDRFKEVEYFSDE